MRIAITGATGLVGYPLARYLIRRGHDVVAVGRNALPGVPHIPWQLGDAGPDLRGQEHLVHAAFSHVPGRYRGGEGDDPEEFIARNQTGTLALWDAARKAKVHAVFLSSRAVYDGYPAGTQLTEDLEPRADTLYGKVKLEAEAALGHEGVSIRATGVVGPPVPGRRHKWADLFERYRRQEPVAPGIGTEIHSMDLARAVEIVLKLSLKGTVLNASGFVLDRRMILKKFERVSGVSGQLPPSCDPASVSVMNTSRLRQLGWSPTGPETLAEVIRALI